MVLPCVEVVTKLHEREGGSRLPALGDGQREGEGAALVRAVAFGPDAAAVDVDDLLADRQPQPGAADAVARFVRDAVEALEDPGLDARRQSQSMVAHGDAQPTAAIRR